jgi:hypothetical protein
MTPVQRWLIGGCALSLLTGCVVPPMAPSAQPAAQGGSQRQTVILGTISGARQPVRGVQALDTDCETTAPLTGRVLEAPAHGTVSFGVINQINVGGRLIGLSRCRNGNDPTLMSYYQSTPGYRGPDRTVIEMTAPPMSPQSFAVLIDVQ